jgi:hydrogenase nickel incorporation protein HypB
MRSGMKTQKVTIVEKIMDANEQIANTNRHLLDAQGVFSLNIMASPGSGKTSLILSTIKAIKDQFNLGVIEGDTAPVTIDADKVIAAGMPAVQVNTGGNCHLDAMMIQSALPSFDLKSLDMLIVENVGNLVCPAGFALGTHANIVVASIPEGDDKPYKYPNIYRGIDVLILNKIDLLPYVDFRMDYFISGIRMLNPDAAIFPVSCKTGEGMDAWVSWLNSRVMKRST